MTNFTKLIAYLNRIAEVAEEDSASVVSLGVTPAVQGAIQELNRLEQQNCPNCGHPGLSDSINDTPKKRSAPEYPPATPRHFRTN